MQDVVAIGGGHNGLVRGACLAAPGLDVTVIEANDTPGGCIWTETLAPSKCPGWRQEFESLSNGAGLYRAMRRGS